MKHLPLSIVALFFVAAPVSALAAPASCTPYQCMDGTQIARCNEEDMVIDYIAAPCFTHGGEKDAHMFSDVPATHLNSDAIAYVKDRGIVSGYPDGTFRPDQQINRAEFTKILIAGNYPPDFDGPGPEECLQDAYVFLDVSREWFAKYVCTAKAGGLIDGYPDGTFRPAANINFVEAAKILSKNFDLPLTDGTNSWYENYVRALSAKNAIPTSIIRFDQSITRGEMAEMIYRLKAGVTNKTSKTYEDLKASDDAAQASSNIQYEVHYNLDSQINVPLEEQYDGPLIAHNIRTGVDTVLVPKVKDALPALRETWNLTIAPFLQPKGALPIFKTVLKETDNSGGKFYQFNPVTHAFTLMYLNSVYSGFYDGTAVSQDQTHVVWVKDAMGANNEKAQSLYVASFVDDSYDVLVQLSGNETFNGGPSDAMGVQFDIQWIDNSSVRFAVYDQAKKDAHLYDKDALIGYRTVRVK